MASKIKHNPFLLYGSVLAIVLAIAAPALAEFITIKSSNVGSTSCTGGLCINAGALTAAKSTGWIPVEGYDSIYFDITTVDADDSVTAVTMICETSLLPTTAVGGGADICAVATSAATSTVSCPRLWSYTTGTAGHYGILVEDLNAAYINCTFDATGSPGAADTVTVRILKRSP